MMHHPPHLQVHDGHAEEAGEGEEHRVVVQAGQLVVGLGRAEAVLARRVVDRARLAVLLQPRHLLLRHVLQQVRRVRSAGGEQGQGFIKVICNNKL